MRLIAKFGSVALVSAFAVLTLSGCDEEGPKKTTTIPDNDDTSTDPIPDDPKDVPAFVRYCKKSNNPDDVLHTLNMIIEKVVDKDEAYVTCDEVFRRLMNRPREMDLSNRGIKSLLPLGGLFIQDDLDLSGNQISDLTGLDELKHIRHMDLSDNLIVDATGIEKISSLSSLDFSNNPLRNLAGIDKLKDLDSINISRTFVADGSALVGGAVTQLEMKGLSEMEDYSFVGKMGHLKRLIITQAGLKSLDFITERNKDIIYLNIVDNEIRDIEPLLKLSKLVALHIDRNKVENIDGVLNFTALTDLTARRNKIRFVDSDAIKNPSVLEHLDLYSNESLESMGFVEKLTKLKTLNFGRGQVREVPDLSKHTDLQNIVAGSNWLLDKSAVNVLSAKNATKVDLSNNHITRIDLSDSHPQLALVELDIAGNNDMSSLEFLKNTPKLTSLRAWGTSINEFPKDVGGELVKLSIRMDLEGKDDQSKIHPVFGLPKLNDLTLFIAGSDRLALNVIPVNESLKKLTMSGSRLESSFFLGRLPNLEELEIIGMKLPGLVWAVDLPLKKLDLRHNCIESVKPLAQAPKIWDTLEELNLEDNQITDLDLLPADKLANLKIYKAEKNGKKKEGCGI